MLQPCQKSLSNCGKWKVCQKLGTGKCHSCFLIKEEGRFKKNYRVVTLGDLGRNQK